MIIPPSQISTKSILKQLIFDRLVELAIVYGKALSHQEGDLKERYKNELKQRFEELLHMRDSIEKENI